jgi:hypothetical protein
MADVTSKLLGQFADSLEATVLAGSGGKASDAHGTAGPPSAADAVAGSKAASVSSDGHADGAGATGAHSTAKSESSPPPPAAAPVDLMGVAGPVIAKRLAVPVLNVLGLVILWRVVRRVRRRAAA